MLEHSKYFIFCAIPLFTEAPAGEARTTLQRVVEGLIMRGSEKDEYRLCGSCRFGASTATRAAEQIEPTFEENLPAAMEFIKRIL